MTCHHGKCYRLLACILLFTFVLAACGKNEKKTDSDKSVKATQSPNLPADDGSGDTEPVDPDLMVDDPDEDTYDYPDGDWGDGFNYGTVRGRWRVTVYGPIEDIYGDQVIRPERLITLIDAMGLERPQVRYSLMMRFIDPTHMEGRITLDSSEIVQTIVDMYATEEGICKLYGALYGLSKNEVKYYLAQSGVPIDQLVEAIRTTLEPAIADDRVYVVKKEISDTFTLSDGKVLFENLDLCLEYDEESKTLKVFSGANDETELYRFDGAEMLQN